MDNNSKQEQSKDNTYTIKELIEQRFGNVDSFLRMNNTINEVINSELKKIKQK